MWGIKCERLERNSFEELTLFRRTQGTVQFYLLLFFLSLSNLHSSHWYTSQPLDATTLQNMLTRISAVREVHQHLEQEAARHPPSVAPDNGGLQWHRALLFHTRLADTWSDGEQWARCSAAAQSDGGSMATQWEDDFVTSGLCVLLTRWPSCSTESTHNVLTNMLSNMMKSSFHPSGV